MKRIDEIMEWEGSGNGFGKWPSKCRIRVYEHEGQEVIVATELPDNGGTSITNAIESVAMLAISKFKVDVKKMVYVEHYPELKSFGKLTQKEAYSVAAFQMTVKKSPLDPTGRTGVAQLQNPAWAHMKKSHVESLIGEALDA